MGSYPFEEKGIIDAIELKIHDNDLQKPNIYNQYLPFSDVIKQQGFELFNEIRENLSKTIQLAELNPGLSFWSNKLEEFISFYGFHFTKTNHLKLIHFYLSILSINNLDYSNAEICFNMLFNLMRKTKLITRDDLIINWRIFYKWIKWKHDKVHERSNFPKSIEFILCVSYCSPYFSATATREILDELRPQMYPTDWSFKEEIQILDLLLPFNLPPELHDQGFKLWLNEFFNIWENLYNIALWEIRILGIFAKVAWNNIGYINWEPWLSQIFTRILRGFTLPFGKMQTSSQIISYFIPYLTKWIVAMLSNENSCFRYLQDLFIAIRNFYHPSNTGNFQKKIVEFILNLSKHFVDRVHLEQNAHSLWFYSVHESSRLTQENITDFVNCIKEYAFISIYNKDYSKEAAETCQYLSMLRPELIVPSIIGSVFSSIDNITEPYRFTSIMNCLTRITRQLVRYPQGQIYVIPLLMRVLPGIDLNDYEKTLTTLDFLNAIFKVIICVDCSSAVNTRNDLTDMEKEICLSTIKFEDFIIQFLNRIFQMIEILSTDVSNDIPATSEVNSEENTIESKFISILSSIVQQCSDKIFQTIREKIVDFLSCEFLSPKVRKFIGELVRSIAKNKPTETLKYLLPKTCNSIEKIMNSSESNALLTDDKGDIELTWYLTLFSELVCARDAYGAIANAANHLLKSLVHVYPMDYRLTNENINEPFIDFLPIRLWGQHVDIDKLQVQFHIPNINEVDFACEFVNTFIYPELILLNEKSLILSNNERLRSLTIIYHIAIGCFNMVPFIDSKKVEDLVSTVVPCESRKRNKYSIYDIPPKFKENLRMRLLIDIEKLFEVLVENRSDDVKSIKAALKIYSLSSAYRSVSDGYVSKLRKDIQSSKKLFKNKLYGKRQNPRFLLIKQLTLQMKRFESNKSPTFTEIDRQIALKLFDLSINRYSEVRRKAQSELFSLLHHYPFSYQVIIDRIIDLLTNETDDTRIKGCLHILHGNYSFFLPTEKSWMMMEKLWPSIAIMNYTKKVSTQNLVNNIHKKITKNFVMNPLIQDTNEASKHAAAALWLPLKSDGIQQARNERNIQSYTNLMENLNSLLKRDTLTWRQQKTILSLLYILLQKYVPIPLSCVQTFVDFLIHDNIELRKCAAKGIAVFCRYQKPLRTFEEILQSSSTECQPGDRDDNVWVTIDGYKPPKTQIEWEQTCFLDKLYHGYYTWPKKIKYSLNKRTRYTEETMPEQVTILYDRFIDTNFLKRFIQLIIYDEDNGNIKFDEIRFAVFKGLFRNFGLLFLDNFMEQLHSLILEETSEKQKGSHRIAAEIVAGIIRGSKYWTLEMLDDLWNKLTPFLTMICTKLDTEIRFLLENTDPRRMYRPIDFLRKLINNQITSNTLNESSCWFLIQSLKCLKWRIPSIWCEINKKARELLDHPSKSIRDDSATLLSISLMYDVTLFNGESTRHPTVNQFFDDIDERLRTAIEICDKTPLLANISGDVVEMDSEARKALNFIETVIGMLITFLFQSRQPIKSSLIRIFPYLCEMEGNNIVFKNMSTHVRMDIGNSYLHTHYLEALIQKLEEMLMNSKWHARRAAIDFIQNMIFSNLFNARPYAKQIHEIVLKYLFDEQLEVRRVASTTLSGLYQCGYLQVTDEDLKYFRTMSNTNYLTEIDGKRIISAKNIVQRHGGVLGFCAIILSSPYDISIHVPDALMFLCDHSNDPNVIQQCLSEFRRTHYDSWHEHQSNFTEEQLLILTDVLITHSYYA